MTYIVYRKSDNAILGYSGTIPDYWTPEMEIETNTIRWYGGKVDDYGVLEITEDEERKRQDKNIKFVLHPSEQYPIGITIEELPPKLPASEPVDEEKAALAEAVIFLSNELDQLKAEIAILKGGN